MFNYNYPFDFRLLNWGYHMSLGGERESVCVLTVLGLYPSCPSPCGFFSICLVVEDFLMLNSVFFLITSFSVNSCNFGVSLDWEQVLLTLLS